MPPGVACRLFLEHSARVRAAAPRLRHEPARGLEQRRRRAALGAHRVVRRVQQVVELAAPEHQVPRLHEHSRHAVKKHAPVPSAARLDDGAAARVSRTNARFRSGTVLARLRLRVVVVVVAVVGVIWKMPKYRKMETFSKMGMSEISRNVNLAEIKAPAGAS